MCSNSLRYARDPPVFDAPIRNDGPRRRSTARLFLKGKGGRRAAAAIFLRLRHAVLREHDQPGQAQPAHGAEIPFQFGPEGIMPPWGGRPHSRFFLRSQNRSHILRGEIPRTLRLHFQQLRPRSPASPRLRRRRGDGEHVPNRCPGLSVAPAEVHAPSIPARDERAVFMLFSRAGARCARISAASHNTSGRRRKRSSVRMKSASNQWCTCSNPPGSPDLMGISSSTAHGDTI